MWAGVSELLPAGGHGWWDKERPRPEAGPFVDLRGSDDHAVTALLAGASSIGMFSTLMRLRNTQALQAW